MNEGKSMETGEQWVCTKCGRPLSERQVQVRYLGNAFSVTMFTCIECGTAMVTEEMALNKMAEAEKILEDK
jgi:RNase P subunit RPR2